MEKKRNAGGSSCAMKNCNNSSRNPNDGNSYFRFPKDPQRSMLWVQACNRQDLLEEDPVKLFNKYRVCSAHFSQKMFLNDLKNRLHNHATPVVMSSTNEDVTNSNSNVSNNEEKSLYSSSCCLLKRKSLNIEQNPKRMKKNKELLKEILSSPSTSILNKLSATEMTQTSTSSKSITRRKDKLRHTIISVRKDLF